MWKMVDKILLLELKKVCDEVCFEKNATGGRVSAFDDVCLERIAENLPRTQSELLAIKGINPASVSKFGGFILECVENRLSETLGISTFSSMHKSIFEKLSDEIKEMLLTSSSVELSHRFQIVESSAGLEDFVKGESVELTILKREKPNFDEVYEKIIGLQKERDRGIFVGGRDELCLGLFRATGKLCGGILKIDAPLVLLPVKLDVSYNEVKILLDDSRKPSLNNTLQVLNGVPNFDITQYLHLGLEELKNIVVEKFKNAKVKFYEDENFYGNGLVVKNETVLECFDSLDFDNLQKIEKIVQKNEINKTLDVVLCGGENSLKNAPDEEVFNISQTNFTESKVLKNYQKQSVVAVNVPLGEDGFNLMQNLVSDTLSKNQNCLIVAKDEDLIKKAYQNLGELNKFAVKIDGEKSGFKARVKELLKQGGSIYNISKNEIFDLLDAENCIKQKLVARDKCLYSESENFGSMDNFYSEVEDLMLKNSNFNIKNEELIISDNQTDISVDELLLIKRKFEDLDLTQKVLDFLSMSKSYPWLQDIKRGLTKKDVVSLVALSKSYSEGDKKAIKELCKKYFVSTKTVKMFAEKPQLLQLSLVNFDYFESCLLDFSLLSENEKSVLNLVSDCVNNYKIKIDESLNFVIKSILVQKLKLFEAENKKILGVDNSNFDELINDFITIELEKNNRVSKFLTSKLASTLRESLAYSKRIEELQKRLGGENFEFLSFLTDFRAEMFGGVKIWLVSTENLSKLPLNCNLFDQTIVLDALNIQTANSVGLLYRSKRLVAFGDTAKLVLKSENLLTDKNFKIESSFNLSLFENACDNGEVYKLKYILGSVQELFDFVNYSMYDGELINFQNKSVTKGGVMVIQASGKAQFGGVNGIEARKVVMVFKKVLQSSKNQSVGIVTFNYPQKYEILKRLKFLIFADAEFRASVEKYLAKFNLESVDELVKTAFEMYNKQFSICILSTIVSVNKFREVEGGDIFEIAGGKELLNMAITRASKKLIVVTSVTAEELSRPTGGTLALQIMSSFLSFAGALASGKEIVCQRILDLMKSVFCVSYEKGLQLKQLKSILEDNGLELKALSDEYLLLKNNCIIEIESVLKKKYPDAIERDLYRMIAIKKSGLSAYRIFDNNFIENLDAELQKIKSIK